MIYYKTNEEIELIRESSLLVAKTLAEVAKVIKPGITTITLDNHRLKVTTVFHTVFVYRLIQ